MATPNAHLDAAFAALDRADFLPGPRRREAEIDAPIDIGFQQTNSQPSTVRAMLSWLDVKRGQKILDVGSGSGWTTALLGLLVGKTGHVYGVERIDYLVEFGAINCAVSGATNVTIKKAGKTLGLPQFAPYDRILVSAAADDVPGELLDQLVVSGKIVIPVGTDVQEITKTAPAGWRSFIHPGFSFVPLIY